ncbi:MAG TPA: type II toxin-antitoxin system prevent-host-death family antitoxin [Acidimicrobiia bacterium]|nr:type II toxin-antitoxin system prevent-host-death family antitoxin [Acidimicrobiia bacterium]
MRVPITELKARLSHYLRIVERGTEVTVLDRGQPVALLTPVAVAEDEARERLIASGTIRPGLGNSVAAKEPPPDLGIDLSNALAEDREDRF